MRELVGQVAQWCRQGATVGVATVVQTWRSAPLGAGASMAVGPGAAVIGSVSGGCVEGAVFDLATEVVASGQPLLRRFGVSDDEALAVGLTCGGVLEVFVEPVSTRTYPDLDEVAADIEAGRPVAVVTVIEHPHADRVGRRLVVRAESVSGSLGSARIDDAVTDDARGLLAAGRSQRLTYGPDGQRRGEGMGVFVQVFAAPPRMLVFGAIDFAASLAQLGSFLGYRVTVCDARPVFATPARFPYADEVVVRWPHQYLADERDAGRLTPGCVVCVLTHDPKFDVPLLEVALRLPQVAYVGAMGSRRTHADRLGRLREVGLSEDELARLSSPIGLDLGARTPQETAVSIAAEIIALRWGGRGDRLTRHDGPIHHAGAEPPMSAVWGSVGSAKPYSG